MNTLTLSAPQVNALMTAGFTAIRVSKSTSQSSAGPFAAVSPDVPLVSNQTSYTFVDAMGAPGDWYVTQYLIPPSTLSSATAPQPGYLSDLCNSVRDLLGVSIVEAADATIQASYLPSALARVHSRLATFDSLVAAGGDTGALCVSALTYLTAANLCPRMSMQVMDMEIFAQYRYQRNRALDWNLTQQTLMAQYEVFISQASGETADDDDSYIPGLVLAGPTSGGYDVSGGLVPFDHEGGVRTPSVYPPDTGD